MDSEDLPAMPLHEGHEPDWRVRPNQVIIMILDSRRIEVVCAKCGESSMIMTRVGSQPNLDDVSTWRKFRVE